MGKRTISIRKKILALTCVLALTVALVSPSMPGRVARAASYQWVQTATNYYSPNGLYVSKQNSQYKYNCSYKGLTADNYVCFLASGGFYHQSDGTKNMLADYYHECLQPEAAYAPGGTVTLTTRFYTEDSSQEHYNGKMDLVINKYDASLPGDKYFNAQRITYFFDSNNKSYEFAESTGSTTTKGDTSPMKDTVTASMPKSANEGETIAIIFRAKTSYDSYSDTYENGYGGNQFFEWIYTYQKVEEPVEDTPVVKPDAGVVKKIANVKGAKAKVTVNKVVDAEAYQIRYRVGKSKKWTTPKESKKNTFKINVKKGNKVTVQARVKNTAGWGDWGKNKTFKTDKK